MNFDLSEDQLAALRRIVSDWIGEGFTTPPYKAAYYVIFEALELDPEDFYDYDIRRPGGTTEEQ